MANFFWVDLEMTGLDEKVDSILEVAVVIADPQSKTLEEFHRVVYQPQSVLDSMNDWCKKQHGESGLTAQVPNGIPLATVEKELIALVERHFSAQHQVVLAGNSVGNDRRFIDQYLPEFAKRLHYRLLDVSSFKEIFRERYGISFQKSNSHRAIDDIHESIREMEHFLSFVKIPDAKPEGKQT